LKSVGYLGASDFDRSIRSETVAIRSMTLGVPVTNAALYLAEKVGAARIRRHRLNTTVQFSVVSATSARSLFLLFTCSSRR
jgi:hypothetical protein